MKLTLTSLIATVAIATQAAAMSPIANLETGADRALGAVTSASMGVEKTVPTEAVYNEASRAFIVQDTVTQSTFSAQNVMATDIGGRAIR